MCEAGRVPGSVGEALVMLDRALGYLAGVDAAGLARDEQAGALVALERAEARHTAARARMLAAFTARGGYEDDGHGAARTWLRWRVRVTRGAAAGAVGWMRRLAGHPVIAAALAAGEVSASWAREICGWTDRLPAGRREEAEAILVAAAKGGAELADLAALAQEIYERAGGGEDGASPDQGQDRGLWLGTTLGGAGRLEANLTAGCAAAISAVLEPLAHKAGPEDSRSAAQRRHDALAEACRRLLAAGLVPGRAGQPAQALVHLTLAQLRELPGAGEAEQAWLAARARGSGWLTGPEAGAAACDATLAPVVSGHVDPTALDRLVELVLGGPPGGGPPGDGPLGDGPPGGRARSRGQLSPAAAARLRQTLLGLAADVLSGPGGLAAWLRRSLLDGPLAAPSLDLDVPLPLDSAPAAPAIPAHLRRAVTTRHPNCAFPGCHTPATACQIHHLQPRARGGRTILANLVPLCEFHHLIVIHTWGWNLALNPNGTTTATSPHGTILHSHSPPTQAA